MAVFDIGWASIAPNSRLDWFIHGWNDKQAISYSIVVLPGSGNGVPNPVGRAVLTQGEYFQHVDGTFAQTVHIQNTAPFNSCDVHLIAQVESL